jgi:hypothetical protein
MAPRAESWGGAWRCVWLSLTTDLPQIMRSRPCRPDSWILFYFIIFFSRCGCNEVIEGTDINFKDVKRRADDWNYETVAEHMKDAWKHQ